MSVSPRHSHVVSPLPLLPPGGAPPPAAPAVTAQRLIHPVSKGADGLVVKVHVGQRGEKAVRQQPRDLRRVFLSRLTDLRQTDQAAHQRIL